MSHSKEREEKICLNCGAALAGRYCHICGQENTEPKETVWTLVSHFFNDITHFDGKFFSTVKYLITKPGFLSAEYIKGRRASYLHPIRMYVFTSAFFFIIFFSLFKPGDLINAKKEEAEQQLKELRGASNSLKERLPEIKDADVKAAMLRSINNMDAHAALLIKEIALQQQNDSVKLAKAKILFDSTGKRIKNIPPLTEALAQNNIKIDSINSLKKLANDDPDPAFFVPGNINLDYRSQMAYDSVQKELPVKKRDGWFRRSMLHKKILFNTKWKDDKKEAMALFMEKFMHTLPQALFLSLPVFALILLLLYARRKFYYADHGIFAIHLYCACFIILLLYFGIDKLKITSGWEWLEIINVLLMLSIFFYLYKAMRKFYGQGRFKTIMKFIILNFFSLIVVIILVVSFLLISLMQFS